MKNIRSTVLFVPSAIFIIVLIAGFIDIKTFNSVLTGVFERLMVNMGWLVSLTMLVFVIFCLTMLFHPIGKIRIGGPNAKPKMTRWQWFAVSLCAGIGTGVVFWGAVEPLLFTMQPAPSLGIAPGSNEAVIWAMSTTFLHWTLTPYAIYITFGVILAYVCGNMRKPFNPSSGFVPLIGDRALSRKFGDIVDTFSIFALAGGIAGSLGYGILQLSRGVDIIFGIPSSTFIYCLVAAAIVAFYTLTCISGLKKGIMWLGDQNGQIYMVLLFFMLVTGPTAYIFNLGTQSTGTYLQNFIERMTYTAPFNNAELWPQWWDMYWWVDWLSYGPIMGLFFVKLSYGRTIREFVTVNWLLPSIFGIVWFSIFGGTVLHAQLFEGADLFALYKAKGAEILTFAAFDYIPFSVFVKPFMLIVIAISFVTLANSMVATISLMSMRNNLGVEEGPTSLKIYWGLMLGSVSLLFTLSGGIDGIKMVKTFCGFPIMFMGLFMVYGFVKYMGKRPRDAYGNYLYEDAVADAPDSGEPMAKQSAVMRKLSKLFGIEIED